MVLSVQYTISSLQVAPSVCSPSHALICGMYFVAVFLCEYENFVLTFQVFCLVLFFLIKNNIQRKGNKATHSLLKGRIIMSYILGKKCKHLKCNAVDEMPRTYHANKKKKIGVNFPLVCIWML